MRTLPDKQGRVWHCVFGHKVGARPVAITLTNICSFDVNMLLMHHPGASGVALPW